MAEIVENTLKLETKLSDIMSLKSSDAIIHLNDLVLKDEKFNLFVIRDDSPLVNNIYQLWYKVYVEEKGFPIHDKIELEK
ncbi:MAG: hypothetical protein ABIJ26_05660, partial [Candidatus Margulisiibacteriota bacterium]